MLLPMPTLIHDSQDQYFALYKPWRYCKIDKEDSIWLALAKLTVFKLNRAYLLSVTSGSSPERVDFLLDTLSFENIYF